MASATLAEQADCLADLGRLDEAAAKYEDAIARDECKGRKRDVAVKKVNLATVHWMQGEYGAALAAYTDARDIFDQLNEPTTVAKIWHQIGRVRQEAGNDEAAEEAYRKSLGILIKSNHKVGQAMSLGQLGNLYDACLNRREEAVLFYREAADIFVELGDLKNEGAVRNNIAQSLIKLHCYDDARVEIERAIECNKPFGHAAQPWTAFGILHQIETDTGHPAEAQSAWQQARDAYLAYREQGGYPQSVAGKLADTALGMLAGGKDDEAIELLHTLIEATDAPASIQLLATEMLAVLRGEGDSSRADNIALDYAATAELLFFMERWRRLASNGPGKMPK